MPKKSSTLKKLPFRKSRTEAELSSKTQIVKQHYNTSAKGYAQQYDDDNRSGHFYNTRVQMISDMIRDIHSGKVLDIGCGPGFTSNIFDQKPVEYYGVDISQGMITECIRRFGKDPKLNFCVGNIQELPFPDSCFDLVLCVGAIEYVQEARIAICEIARVLKPGGIAINTMWSRFSPNIILDDYIRRNLSRLKNKIRRRQLITNSKLNLYSERSFRNLLSSCGLKIEGTVYYEFSLVLRATSDRFRDLPLFLTNRLDTLCRRIFRSLFGGFIVESKKS